MKHCLLLLATGLPHRTRQGSSIEGTVEISTGCFLMTRISCIRRLSGIFRHFCGFLQHRQKNVWAECKQAQSKMKSFSTNGI